MTNTSSASLAANCHTAYETYIPKEITFGNQSRLWIISVKGGSELNSDNV